MAERSYNQYCGIAHALDVVGERWTLLIIRELLMGPRRFKDLQEGLPGIGTNLLSDRLKKLQEYGIIRQRELPPPAASTVYELTDTGRELQPVLESLGDWGTRFLGSPDEDEVFNPRWLLLALKTKFQPEKTRGVDKVIVFDIDDEVLYAHIHDGEIETRQGGHPDADLTIRAGNRSFLRLVTGDADLDKDSDQLDLILEGEAGLLEKLGEWFEE